MLLEIAMREMSRQLNLAPRAPLNLMVLNSPDVVVGPRPWELSLIHPSGYDGAIFYASKLRWEKRRGAQSSARCPLQMDG